MVKTLLIYHVLVNNFGVGFSPKDLVLLKGGLALGCR